VYAYAYVYMGVYVCVYVCLCRSKCVEGGDLGTEITSRVQVSLSTLRVCCWSVVGADGILGSCPMHPNKAMF
jgi:hypothetical protein